MVNRYITMFSGKKLHEFSQNRFLFPGLSLIANPCFIYALPQSMDVWCPKQGSSGRFIPIKIYTSHELISSMKSTGKTLLIYRDDLKLWQDK